MQPQFIEHATPGQFDWARADSLVDALYALLPTVPPERAKRFAVYLAVSENAVDDQVTSHPSVRDSWFPATEDIVFHPVTQSNTGRLEYHYGPTVFTLAPELDELGGAVAWVLVNRGLVLKAWHTKEEAREGASSVTALTIRIQALERN